MHAMCNPSLKHLLTSSLASLSPNPVIALISLMTLILPSGVNEASLTSNSVFSFFSTGAASVAAAAAAATGAGDAGIIDMAPIIGMPPKVGFAMFSRFRRISDSQLDSRTVRPMISFARRWTFSLPIESVDADSSLA
jgi:hypothetical protein